MLLTVYGRMFTRWLYVVIAPTVDPNASAVTAVWSYLGTLAFNLLVLVGAVKGCDRIVREIVGL